MAKEVSKLRNLKPSSYFYQHDKQEINNFFIGPKLDYATLYYLRRVEDCVFLARSPSVMFFFAISYRLNTLFKKFFGYSITNFSQERFIIKTILEACRTFRFYLPFLSETAPSQEHLF